MRYGLDTKVEQIDDNLLNKLSNLNYKNLLHMVLKNLDLLKFLGLMMSQ